MIVYPGFTVAEDRLKWWPLGSKSDGTEHVTSTDGEKSFFMLSIPCVFTVLANKCTQLLCNSQ